MGGPEIESHQPTEETEKRSPQAGDKIRVLLKGVDIREIANGVAYFSHLREQLKVPVDKLIPAESGEWEAKDLQENENNC